MWKYFSMSSTYRDNEKAQISNSSSLLLMMVYKFSEIMAILDICLQDIPLGLYHINLSKKFKN